MGLVQGNRCGRGSGRSGSEQKAWQKRPWDLQRVCLHLQITVPCMSWLVLRQSGHAGRYMLLHRLGGRPCSRAAASGRFLASRFDETPSHSVAAYRVERRSSRPAYLRPSRRGLSSRLCKGRAFFYFSAEQGLRRGCTRRQDTGMTLHMGRGSSSGVDRKCLRGGFSLPPRGFWYGVGNGQTQKRPLWAPTGHVEGPL